MLLRKGKLTEFNIGFDEIKSQLEIRKHNKKVDNQTSKSFNREQAKKYCEKEIKKSIKSSK